MDWPKQVRLGFTGLIATTAAGAGVAKAEPSAQTLPPLSALVDADVAAAAPVRCAPAGPFGTVRCVTGALPLAMRGASPHAPYALPHKAPAPAQAPLQAKATPSLVPTPPPAFTEVRLPVNRTLGTQPNAGVSVAQLMPAAGRALPQPVGGIAPADSPTVRNLAAHHPAPTATAMAAQVQPIVLASTQYVAPSLPTPVPVQAAMAAAPQLAPAAATPPMPAAMATAQLLPLPVGTIYDRSPESAIPQPDQLPLPMTNRESAPTPLSELMPAAGGANETSANAAGLLPLPAGATPATGAPAASAPSAVLPLPPLPAATAVPAATPMPTAQVDSAQPTNPASPPMPAPSAMPDKVPATAQVAREQVPAATAPGATTPAAIPAGMPPLPDLPAANAATSATTTTSASLTPADMPPLPEVPAKSSTISISPAAANGAKLSPQVTGKAPAPVPEGIPVTAPAPRTTPEAVLRAEQTRLSKETAQSARKQPAISLTRASASRLADMAPEEVERHEGVGVSISVKKPGLDAAYELGQAYSAMMGGDSMQAIAVYQRILAAQPRNTDALFGLATIYHRTGQLDKAKPLYATLLAIQPDHRDGLNNFLMLLGEQNPREALARLQSLEAANPDYAPIPAQIAMIYQRQGDFSGAVDAMTRAAARAPENLQYRYNLAVLLDQSGNWNDAAGMYQEILAAVDRGEKVPSSRDDIQRRLTFLLQRHVS